jgi:hypothetical protein
MWDGQWRLSRITSCEQFRESPDIAVVETSPSMLLWPGAQDFIRLNIKEIEFNIGALNR